MGFSSSYFVTKMMLHAADLFIGPVTGVTNNVIIGKDTRCLELSKRTVW